MSWKGLSKALSRLPHQVKARTGRVEGLPIDDEYNELQVRFNQVAYYIMRLQKELAVYKDTVQDMFERHAHFAYLIADVYYDPEMPEESIPERYSISMDEMRHDIDQELERMDTTIVAPLIEMGQVLQQAERTMAKRRRKKLDYDRFMLGEKDPSLETSAHDYKQYNTVLKSELPILFDRVQRIIQSLFVRLHQIQCAIYKRYMDHAQQVVDVSTIHENIIDDYHQHMEHIPQMLDSLDLFRLFPPSEIGAPIPPPKHFDDESSSGMGHTYAQQQVQGIVGLGIAPGAVDVGSPSSDAHQRRYAIALNDYDAKGVGDLSFHKNQQIEILESCTDIKHRDGWWTARIEGTTGFVPSDHVKMLHET